MRARALYLAYALLFAAACDGTQPDASSASDAADTPAGVEAGADSPAPVASAPDTWPEDGAIDYRREHTADLTGDGRADVVSVTARGPAYDSLDIVLAIQGADGDTLWRESWPSLLYFKYDTPEGKADSTIKRIVVDHVEQLLAPGRFNMDGGLPEALSRAGDPDAIMREAIHYHLAELDWRRAAGLTPAAPTPPDAHSGISTDQVPAARVEAVLAEVRTKPSYMYFAGGEATYAIAWSESENAFVRIHSCC